MNRDDALEHANEQRAEAAAVRERPISPLGSLVFDMSTTMVNVSQEAHRLGMKEGERRAAKRIERLEAALEECLEYFEDHYDVVDGDYGQPAPNREMQMGQMIDTALGRRP